MDSVKSENECQIEMMRKPVKKMPPGPPHIMICVPVGTKDLKSEAKLPDCDQENCSCPNHGKFMSSTTRGDLMVPLQWALNVPNIVVPLNTTMGYIVEGGMLSADARNKMTKRALEAGSKYIFYWDDDVVIPPLAFYTMHNILETNPDIGLVTGVYTTREDPPEPLIYKEHGQGAWWGFTIDPELPPEDIFGAGGGCIMARLEDVAKMEEPYWYDEQIVNDSGNHQTVWGHDVRFIKNFREQTGKRTVVKGSILCTHFDAGKNKSYKLPQDSPPYQRLGKEKNLTHELVEFAELTELMLDQALKASNGEQRLFLVKKDQPQESIRDVLGGRFNSVDFSSVDDYWLAICEGMKNGSNGNSNRTSERGDTPGDRHDEGGVSQHQGVIFSSSRESQAGSGDLRASPGNNH